MRSYFGSDFDRSAGSDFDRSAFASYARSLATWCETNELRPDQMRRAKRARAKFPDLFADRFPSKPNPRALALRSRDDRARQLARLAAMT